MKKQKVVIGALCALIIIGAAAITVPSLTKKAKAESTSAAQAPKANVPFKYPEFYKGIYLTQPTGRDFNKLKAIVDRAKKASINAVVIDVQLGRNTTCTIPKENVEYVLSQGIDPIARVVCFTDGLNRYPVQDAYLQNLINMADSACKAGFKEIQFDYVRFSDASHPGVTLQMKYAFIEGFLARARTALAPYNVKISADVFGRIPLNSGDAIGQRIEGLDKVVDYICPMAYPSHYTWSNKMMADPYYTVYITSKRGKERTKSAEIISYIQAFRMKVGATGMTYDNYIEAQMRACHDAGIRGYFMWNASQDYDVPLKVAEAFYAKGYTPKVPENLPGTTPAKQAAPAVK